VTLLSVLQRCAVILAPCTVEGANKNGRLSAHEWHCLVQIMQMALAGLLGLVSFPEANDITLLTKINSYPITCFFLPSATSFVSRLVVCAISRIIMAEKLNGLCVFCCRGMK
jgi:hypothetical protein